MKAASGNRSSVILVPAVGAIVLTRMSFLAPSIDSVFAKPTRPILAAP